MTMHTTAAQLPGVARAGAAPTPAVMTLAIENMHCGGCLRSVERAVLEVPGVETARASLSAKRVSIAYDPAVAGAGDFIDALKGAGFAAAPIEAAKPGQDKARQSYLLRCVAVAGFAGIGENAEDEWLGTGLTETVATALQEVEGLVVWGREQLRESLRRLGETARARGVGCRARYGTFCAASRSFARWPERMFAMP